jgi:hypothetical protein
MGQALVRADCPLPSLLVPAAVAEAGEIARSGRS